MTKEEVLKQLEELGNENTKKILVNFGNDTSNGTAATLVQFQIVELCQLVKWRFS